MEYWQLLIVVGILFILVEIFAPMVFFLNFALACFMTAAVAFYIVDWNILVPIFVVTSAIFLIFLRPILIKKRNGKMQTGIDDKYIGKIVKVIETVTSSSGVVSIYDERWSARSNTGEEFEAGSEVKIVRNESLILYVEKEA